MGQEANADTAAAPQQALDVHSTQQADTKDKIEIENAPKNGAFFLFNTPLPFQILLIMMR